MLLDDLLGIADPDVPLPKIDPDARRRRLTAMINATSLARTEPALYLIEDAQWIESFSELKRRSRGVLSQGNWSGHERLVLLM